MDEQQREEIGYFAIEKCATFLGTTSMFLAILYFLYSMALFTMKDIFAPKIDETDVPRYVAPSEAIA